ncbi:hypothetical protein NKR19_g2701 [Coniochaeta hoffmannii]|uniref:Uncharacterized protein n=1 Tax=Coniochaeta hoffmannii TaxID=91930 RepID=A0AA38W244_9PEZI|nr:hypothetical protein NKR19_g2701 [Coniochaeta hoffmannii]
MCHICRRLGIIPPQIPDSPDSDDEDTQEDDAATEEGETAQVALLPRAPRLQLYIAPRTLVVTERAPSHDAASTWAAYEVPASVLPSHDSDYNSSVPADTRRAHRPAFGLRIYDATSDATAGRAEQLARRISELTCDQRLAPDSAQGDRIEVVALPSSLPPGRTTSEEDDEGEEERIYALATACVAHNEAERAVRLAVSDPAQAASWYLVEDILANYGGCRKRMWVIDDLPSSWEEGLRRGAERSRRGGELGAVSVGSAGGDGGGGADGDGGGGDGAHGHFLEVRYDQDPNSYGDEEDEEREMEGKPRRELYVIRRPFEKLGEALANFRGVRGNVFHFYQRHFIPDGVLDRELAAARAGGGIGGGETTSLAGAT